MRMRCVTAVTDASGSAPKPSIYAFNTISEQFNLNNVNE